MGLKTLGSLSIMPKNIPGHWIDGLTICHNTTNHNHRFNHLEGDIAWSIQHGYCSLHLFMDDIVAFNSLYGASRFGNLCEISSLFWNLTCLAYCFYSKWFMHMEAFNFHYYTPTKRGKLVNFNHSLPLVHCNSWREKCINIPSWLLTLGFWL